jgi:two-component system chemotaxis response regulator CheY
VDSRGASRVETGQRKRPHLRNQEFDMAKVLIVDDAEFLRVRVSKMLTTNGHEVLEAENGLKAVETYKSLKPDVVLMDVTMPEMDGLAALKEIRMGDPNARVVMLTALGQESVVLEAIKSGAKDFVVKPFEPARVLAALGKALA